MGPYTTPCIHANICSSKVDLGHRKKVTREAIDLNETLLETVLQQLGSRVGVELVYFHLDALYKLMKVPVDRFMA